MEFLPTLFIKWKSKELDSLNETDTSEIKEDLFIERNSSLNETGTLEIKEDLLCQYRYCTL